MEHRIEKLSCRRDDFVIPTTGEFLDRVLAADLRWGVHGQIPETRHEGAEVRFPGDDAKGAARRER